METSTIEQTSGRRPTGRLPLLLTLAVAALALAGCSGSGSTPTAGTTTVAAVSKGPSVTESPAQTVTFTDLKRAIDRLYSLHPGINDFVVDEVQYNKITRDKVVSACRKGAFGSDPASRESLRVAGCAPLVFFFYEYGRQRSVPESIEVARKLYWYAAASIHGPFSARDTLNGLLRTWGIP